MSSRCCEDESAANCEPLGTFLFLLNPRHLVVAYPKYISLTNGDRQRNSCTGTKSTTITRYLGAKRIPSCPGTSTMRLLHPAERSVGFSPCNFFTAFCAVFQAPDITSPNAIESESESLAILFFTKKLWLICQRLQCHATASIGHWSHTRWQPNDSRTRLQPLCGRGLDGGWLLGRALTCLYPRCP